jgi:hypothetical protein
MVDGRIIIKRTLEKWNECTDVVDLIQDRDQCSPLVKAAKNPLGSIKLMELFEWLIDSYDPLRWLFHASGLINIAYKI